MAGQIVFFSDEKTFDVDPHHNAQNDRFVRFPGDDNSDSDEGEGGEDVRRGQLYITKTKHPAAAMFLGVVASTGEVGPVIWWPGGYQLNADGYINALDA